MVLHKPGVINLLFSNRGADFVYSIPDDTGIRKLGRFNKRATLDKISIAYLVNALGGVGVYNYTTPRNILYNLINDDNVRYLPIDIAVFDMGEINLYTDSEKIILQESPWQREMNKTERRMTREVGLSGPGNPENPSSLASPTIMLPRDVIRNITGFTTPQGKRFTGYGGKYKRKTIMRKRKSKRRRTTKRK